MLLKEFKAKGLILSDTECRFEKSKNYKSTGTWEFHEIVPTGMLKEKFDAWPKDEIPDPPCGEFGNAVEFRGATSLLTANIQTACSMSTSGSYKAPCLTPRTNSYCFNKAKMNYRHAFHAGNHADVLKHIVMARIIEHLKRKDKPFRVFDAHAGIGVYALDGAEAQKTGEWQGGIAKMQEAFAPEVEALLAPYRKVLAGLNPDGGFMRCPGSPEVIARLLRPEDRFTLNELHPDDYAALRDRYYIDARAGITGIDATVLMKANLPPPERRGWC